MSKEVIFDLATGETSSRDLSPEEIAEFEANAQKVVAQREAEALKAAEKIAILAQLGLTPEQAEKLFS